MEEIKLDTTSQIVISVLVVFFIGLLMNDLPKGFGDMYEEIYQENFIGLVQKKEIEYDNHGMRVIYVNNKVFDINSDFYESISVGDSISKRAGDMVIHLYKKDGRYLYFDYDEYYKTYFTEKYNKYMEKRKEP